jgi:eukaryotic-like serine/threonine-protein kinase
VTDFQSQLSNTHQFMGWALTQTGKPAEAMVAVEQAIAIKQKLIDANPTVTLWQGELATNLLAVGGIHLKAGRTAEAVASLRRAVVIWERLSSRAPKDLYNLACSHTLLAGLAAKPGSGMTVVEGRAEADRAMESLRQAVTAGYRKLNLMRSDTDLDPLRSRPDFQLLMMDVAFPDDPLAR